MLKSICVAFEEDIYGINRIFETKMIAACYAEGRLSAVHGITT